MQKKDGGWRLLTMLEESFKAVEGPVARRKVQVRAALGDGTVFSATNLAGESRRRATGEVLYVDALRLRGQSEARSSIVSSTCRLRQVLKHD